MTTDFDKDNITHLPPSQTNASVYDLKLAESIFTKPSKDANDDHDNRENYEPVMTSSAPSSSSIWDIAKDVLLAGLLFYILSLPMLDGVILSIVPIESPLIVNLIKAVLFMILFAVFRLFL